MVADRQAVLQQKAVGIHLFSELLQRGAQRGAALTNQLAPQDGQDLGECFVVALDTHHIPLDQGFLLATKQIAGDLNEAGERG